MGTGREQKKRIPQTPGSKQISTVWIPTVLLVLGLLIFLLLAKGIAVFLVDRTFYSIPIIGGVARSLELTEFVNLLLFSILGMGLGLGFHLIPVVNPERVARSILIVLIPILFLSSCFFQYQLWLVDVQNEMGLNGSEVRSITNQWLQQTVEKEGIWGFYNYTTLYSILPTNPDRLQASIQGSDRVTQLFAQIFSVPPKATAQILSLCVWGLRGFYLSLSVLAALHHFEDGISQRKRRLEKKSQKIAPNPPREKTAKAYKKLK
ncbi:MAG: hypothetical protein ACO37W_11080 [Prochlorotrichaceae cyanobacterium]